MITAFRHNNAPVNEKITVNFPEVETDEEDDRRQALVEQFIDGYLCLSLDEAIQLRDALNTALENT